MRFMSRRKLKIMSVIVIFIFIDLLIKEIVGVNYNDDTIRFVSIVSSFELISTFIMWKKLTGECISPFSIVYFVAVMFGVGQCFCWAFGVDMGELDLLQYIPRINKLYIGESLQYSLVGLLLFFVGSVWTYKENAVRIKHYDMCDDIMGLKTIGAVSTILLIVSMPCVFINYIRIIPTVLTTGYLGYYTSVSEYSQMGQFIPLLASWFPIALLMKYAIHVSSNKMYAKIDTIALIIYIATILFIGGRSGAVIVILAFLLTKQYFGKPITKKDIVPVGIAGYFGMGILSAIASTRTQINRSLISVFSAFSMSSVIGSLIGELGWSMSSLAWTMQLIDANGKFRLGETYLYALTAVIPNLGFWKTHPALKANLGDWMQQELGRSSGLGYTFIAESFANFSWCGLLVLLIWGMIIGKILNSVTLESATKDYKKAFVVIMLISTVSKAFVRSSFSAVMRQLFFTVLLIYFMMLMMENYLKRKEEK